MNKCRSCKHFFISYDPSAPNGCRLYKIKTTRLPSLIVKEANHGQECYGYSPKETTKSKEKNLNDPSLW